MLSLVFAAQCTHWSAMSRTSLVCLEVSFLQDRHVYALGMWFLASTWESISFPRKGGPTHPCSLPTWMQKMKVKCECAMSTWAEQSQASGMMGSDKNAKLPVFLCDTGAQGPSLGRKLGISTYLKGAKRHILICLYDCLIWVVLLLGSEFLEIWDFFFFQFWLRSKCKSCINVCRSKVELKTDNMIIETHPRT